MIWESVKQSAKENLQMRLSCSQHRENKIFKNEPPE